MDTEERYNLAMYSYLPNLGDLHLKKKKIPQGGLNFFALDACLSLSSTCGNYEREFIQRLRS